MSDPDRYAFWMLNALALRRLSRLAVAPECPCGSQEPASMPGDVPVCQECLEEEKQ